MSKILSNEEKAKLYDSLLIEHDKLASQARNLEVEFNQTPEKMKKVKELKAEMLRVEKKANDLVAGLYQ